MFFALTTKSLIQYGLRMFHSDMKILVCTNHLDRLGGSETWTYTMVTTLRKLGHDVDVFTFQPGIVSEALGGVKETLDMSYNLILVNHTTCMNFLDTVRIKGKRVMTCHGIFPEMEQPVSGAQEYVAISEEVQEHLAKLGFPSVVIRNGIDCERFKPKEYVGPLKRVLSLCQGDEAVWMIAEACKRLEIEFVHHVERVFNIEDEINKAEIVFSLGRGVYETMACGRVPIVFDTRGYTPSYADGMATSGNIADLVKNNCSGRRFKKTWTVEDVVKEIGLYKPEMGYENHNYAIKNFNAVLQAEAYLAL